MSIEEKIKEEFVGNTKILATKEDIANVKGYVANTKAEIIKWMFIYWIGQVAVTFGFILLFLRK